MTGWTCAKCASAVDEARSICRACGSARPRPIRAEFPPPKPIALGEPPDRTDDAPVPDRSEADDGTATGAPPWACDRCGTVVEGEFEVCWRCGATKDGLVDPTFRRVEEVATAVTGSTPRPDVEFDERVPVPPSAPPVRACPACSTALVPIRLRDRNARGGRIDDQLSYSAGDAQPGRWWGLPIAGVVGAQLCPRCGRIDLYAVPTA